MTVSLQDEIISSDVNNAFDLATRNIRWANIYDKSYSNIKISFQALGLGTEYTDSDAYTEYWRSPDDIDVLGIVVDLWGVDAMGINSSQGDVTGGGYTPGNASSLNFNLQVKGNFTAIDEEEGYPQIYKSSEFNLVKDIDLTFDNGNKVVEPLSTNASERNPLSEWGYQVLNGLNGPARKIFFPLNEKEILLSFLRGAQYIFSLQSTNKVVPQVPGSALEVRDVHDLTCLDVSFVCRHTNRRYS